MKNKYLSTLISNYNVMLPKALKANIKNKSNIKYEKICGAISAPKGDIIMTKVKQHSRQIFIIFIALATAVTCFFIMGRLLMGLFRRLHIF